MLMRCRHVEKTLTNLSERPAAFTVFELLQASLTLLAPGHTLISHVMLNDGISGSYVALIRDCTVRNHGIMTAQWVAAHEQVIKAQWTLCK